MSLSKRTRDHKSYIVEELHKCNLLLETREIFLHGYIGEVEDPGVDYRNTVTFVKNLRLLDNMGNSTIIVHQHNIGGDWECGMMMFDAINNSPSSIIFILYGVAASMGSIVPQAADTRVIMPNCAFMIHSGYTGIHSDLTLKQSRSWKLWEDKIEEVSMNIYAERCKNGQFFLDCHSNTNDIKKYIKNQLDEKEDWFLDANDAVKFGFVDGIFGQSGYTIGDLCGK